MHWSVITCPLGIFNWWRLFCYLGLFSRLKKTMWEHLYRSAVQIWSSKSILPCSLNRFFFFNRVYFSNRTSKSRVIVESLLSIACSKGLKSCFKHFSIMCNVLLAKRPNLCFSNIPLMTQWLKITSLLFKLSRKYWKHE